MKKLLFLLLILSACADDAPLNPVYRIDPMFQTYVDEFYTQAQAHGLTFENQNLIVRKLKSGYRDKNGVLISSRVFKKSGQRIIEVSDVSPCTELPVFRELAHVLMELPYSSDDTIMDPYVTPCLYIHEPTGVPLATRQSYIDQLFQ